MEGKREGPIRPGGGRRRSGRGRRGSGGRGGGNGVADMSQSRKLQHQKHQKMGHLTSPRSHPSPFFGRGAASPFGRPSASASAIVGRPATNAAALGERGRFFVLFFSSDLKPCPRR